jgi:hypothetical protein
MAYTSDPNRGQPIYTSSLVVILVCIGYPPVFGGDTSTLCVNGTGMKLIWCWADNIEASIPELV